MNTPERIDVPLSAAAASALIVWLTRVPERVIPVTHPAERQALADLLTSLEMTIRYPDAEESARAREQLLRDAGAWVYEGPVFEPERLTEGGDDAGG
jgi:hypothetical protein